MNQSTDSNARPPSPANRIGIDYRREIPPRLGHPRIDVHAHVNDASHVPLLLEVADLYEIHRIVSMTALARAPTILEQYPDRFRLIAIPRWRMFSVSDAFRETWCDDLRAFHALGARWCKFWVAPPMRGEHGLTLTSAFARPVIDLALDLGYSFMVHVGDPSIWFNPGNRYSDTTRYGTKRDQYPQLEWFLEYVAPRIVIAAHMGGYAENPEFLDGLMTRHVNLMLDTSATKWVVREVSRHPDQIAAFVRKWHDRILFGSDIVTDERYDFDHYASRYWAQQTLWQTNYRGESPIEDPDADNPPKLHGVALPEDLLYAVFCQNAMRIGIG